MFSLWHWYLYLSNDPSVSPLCISVDIPICWVSLIWKWFGKIHLNLYQPEWLSCLPLYRHGAYINKALISAMVHTPQCLGVFCDGVWGMCLAWHTQHMGRTAETAATNESESQLREQRDQIKLDHTPSLETRPQPVAQCSYLSKKPHKCPASISQEKDSGCDIRQMSKLF